MRNLFSLNSLPVGASCRVEKLVCQGLTRRRLLDMGLSEATIVNVLMKSPAGDPTAYKVRGAVLALRSEEASKVLVRLL